MLTRLLAFACAVALAVTLTVGGLLERAGGCDTNCHQIQHAFICASECASFAKPDCILCNLPGQICNSGALSGSCTITSNPTQANIVYYYPASVSCTTVCTCTGNSDVEASLFTGTWYTSMAFTRYTCQ